MSYKVFDRAERGPSENIPRLGRSSSGKAARGRQKSPSLDHRFS